MKKPIQIPSDVLVGQYLQMICLAIAAAIAFVYTCGHVFGAAVHQLNEQLTAFHSLDNQHKLFKLMEVLNDAF